MTKYDPDNVFAKILDGRLPSDPIDADDHTLSFADINPRATVHTLVIPKGKYVDLTDFAKNASDAELAAWLRAIVRVAEKTGVTENGYRLLVNCGKHGGQEVPHIHAHVVGGEPLGAMLAKSG